MERERRPVICARGPLRDRRVLAPQLGERARKPGAPYPWDCDDTPVPGASPEASCIWDALFACVANATAGDGGRQQLYFQSCMEKGWFYALGPQYVPYDWLNTNSAAGHAPYAPSALTLGCLGATTAVGEDALRACVGLDGATDAFLGSAGHALAMADFAYSEATFAAAGVEEAGLSIFVNGALAAGLVRRTRRLRRRRAEPDVRLRAAPPHLRGVRGRAAGGLRPLALDSRCGVCRGARAASPVSSRATMTARRHCR